MIIQSKNSSRLTTCAILIFLIFFATLLAACGKKDGGEKKNLEEKVVRIPVYAKVVHASDFDNRLEVTAKVAPIQDALLSAESSGQVLSAPFEADEDIKKGALLLKIDGTVPASQISLLKSSLKQAQREYDRTKKLASEGLATPQQVDQLSSQVEQANLAIKQAGIALSKSVLRAPISGYVVQKLVEKGEFIAAGHPVARIIDYDTVKVIASVPESEIGYVNHGENVDVEIPALKRTFVGSVYRRAAMANEKSRTFDVEIRIPNEDHEILPGMRAKVLLPRNVLKNIIIVPQSAILQGFNNTEAMVFPGSTNTGKAERRVVELGPTQGDKVVILHGLRDGERLIYKGHRGIVNGTLIEDFSHEIDKKLNAPDSEKTDEKQADSAKGTNETKGAEETKEVVDAPVQDLAQKPVEN